jgi:hypothetical protein
MTATALEERLQELRHTIRVPSLPDVDELAGRATRRRRGRRRRVAVAAGALAVVVLLPAVIVARHGDDPDVRVRTGAPGQPGPPATTPLPVSGIPIDLFESNRATARSSSTISMPVCGPPTPTASTRSTSAPRTATSMLETRRRAPWRRR